MIALAPLGELLDLFVVVVVDPVAIFAGRVVTVLALNDHPDADDTAIDIHRLLLAGFARQAADLEDERRGLVIINRDLGVGGGAVIVVSEAAAKGKDAFRKR